MVDVEGQLRQSVGDRLFAEQKARVSDRRYEFPRLEKTTIELVSIDSGEVFLLDIIPGRRMRDKISFQLRARGTVILARLDIGGPPHRNPDHPLPATPCLPRTRQRSLGNPRTD